MPLAAADATPGLSPVLAALDLGAMASVLVVVFARMSRRRAAPAQGFAAARSVIGDALREVRDERLSEASAEVSLQCGECSTWRRLVANHADFAWEVKALDRDRRLMCAQLEQLGLSEQTLVTRADRARAAGRAHAPQTTRQPRGRGDVEHQRLERSTRAPANHGASAVSRSAPSSAAIRSTETRSSRTSCSSRG